MSKLIPLTQGQVAIVDDDDFEKLNQYKWFVSSQIRSNRRKYYVRRNTGYFNGKQKHIGMHQQLMHPPPGLQIDHIDGNGLNNTRSNLRLATRAQNTANQLPRSRHGYKGVTKHANQWRAQITVNGKCIGLGNFNSIQMAAEIYDKAAKHFFGSFAYLNFPNSPRQNS